MTYRQLASVGPLFLVAAAPADVKFAPMFQSGMVLQQGSGTRVYGTATPGERLMITVGPAKATSVARADGTFDLKMRMPKAGGPYVMTLSTAQGEAQRLDDVLVGEVWFCSGQSNMEWEANWFAGRRFEVGESDLPQLRLFKHPHRVNPTPVNQALGTWIRSDATSSRNFSLVGYLFGRKLHKELKVPVGLIESAWGGTPAESWIDLGSLEADKNLTSLAEKYRKALQSSNTTPEQYEAEVKAWNERTFPLRDTEPVTEPFGAPQPAAIETKRTAFDGVFVLARKVEVPVELAGKDLTLELGPIDDFDVTFWNGERVGFTGPNTPNAYSTPRKYTVPGRLVKAGTNSLWVRVIDTGGEGGFRGTPESLRVGSGNQWIPLQGEWGLRVEADFAKAEERAKYAAPAAPVGLSDPWLPTGLYNGMVAPVAPYSIKGAIWYQGESNVGRAKEYSVLFPAMIQSWRRTWQNPSLAFHFVQLASYGAEGDSTAESGWADLREAQTAALKLPGVGMAVAIDAGEAADIHPIRKDLVADRLARAALARTYRKPVAFEGPTPKRARRNGGTLRVELANGRGLNTLDGSAPRGFAIAGADGKWYRATARFEGEAVLLTAPEVPSPVAARYGWADYIAANVANENGLPMPPFRLRVR